MIRPCLRKRASLFAALVALVMMPAGCEKPGAGKPTERKAVSLADERASFVTKLTKQNSESEPPPVPPAGVFDLIHYPSPAGNLAAYVSPDPKDGQKHPIMIWITGGFSNSISEIAWDETVAPDNDQSAAAYRKAGIPMMYPSLRGGNDNPGVKEGLYGEVDDVLAAAAYAASLPWVDATRIYLGGHSTGGTLALLAAEAAPGGRFRAVVSFGPVEDVAGYGQEILPFDISDAKECRLRAPVRFLDGISCRALVLEGEKGNSDSLDVLRKRSRNEKISFYTVKGQSHFSILSPVNELLAAKIAADTGPECVLRLEDAEVREACAKVRDAALIPAGSLRKDGAAIGLVFYHVTSPSAAPEQAFKQAVEAKLGGIPIVRNFDDTPEPPFIVLQDVAPLGEVSPPDESYLEHAGRGMDAVDVKAIQEANRATIATLVTPADGIWKRLKAFNEAAHDYAASANAFIWDSTTRECFHRDAWKKIRIDGWGEDELADLRSQITIHLYKRGDDSGYLRAVTLGMEKFALPDVAVEHLVSSDQSPAASFINVFCQTIAMNPLVSDPGKFPLSLDLLAPDPVRDAYKRDVLENGSGEALLAIRRGIPDDGDPENDQVALDFRHGEGTKEDEQRSSILSAFWGSSDKSVRVHHDFAIKKASIDARRKLLGLKEKFEAGLPPGSRLLVKAPFPKDDGGTEWMWIEVLKWKGEVLRGTLCNDPFDIAGLKEGADVSVQFKEVFDYLFRHPDGTDEGNETGKLIELQQEEPVEGR